MRRPWSVSRRRPPRRFGGIDVLVCSAGITGPNVPLADYPVDEWKRVFDVNVHGVFLCNRAVVPLMQKKDYGRIVNIASVAGKEGNPNASAYSASKAAVIGLTKSLGKELAKTGIRVNCVTPAAVRTAIFDQMTQQHIDFMLSKIPIGTVRHRGRDRRARRVARDGGLLVLDRRGVRSVGRPRYVLALALTPTLSRTREGSTRERLRASAPHERDAIRSGRAGLPALARGAERSASLLPPAGEGWGEGVRRQVRPAARRE